MKRGPKGVVSVQGGWVSSQAAHQEIEKTWLQLYAMSTRPHLKAETHPPTPRSTLFQADQPRTAMLAKKCSCTTPSTQPPFLDPRSLRVPSPSPSSSSWLSSSCWQRTNHAARWVVTGWLKGSCLLHVLGLQEQLLLWMQQPPFSPLPRLPCKFPRPGQVNKLQPRGGWRRKGG